MGEIGNAVLLDFIRSTLANQQFTSHDFIDLFSGHFSAEYERMVDIYSEYGDICYRNKMVANAIGRYLGNHRNNLHIEKIGVQRSKNINGTISSASVWHQI